MPAPKTLDQHVRDGTFRSRRHHDLLAGPVVAWPRLALLQAGYVAADHPLERRAIGVEFERAVRELDVDENERAERERAEQELRELLDQVDDVDPDEDAANADRELRAVWCRALRRTGMSYRAIGEQVGTSGAQVRRLILRLEREAVAAAGQAAAG